MSEWTVKQFLAPCCVLAGCAAPADSVSPPADRLFFPTGAAVSPDERVLFVANANSDLRYSAGALSVFDLERVDEVIAAWVERGVSPDGCAGDTDHIETLICDESQFILSEASARTGNFATAIAVQDRGAGRARLFVPTRGDPSITWLDWDGTALRCGSADESFAVCDDPHRLAAIGDNFIPSEPFDVAVDSRQHFAVVSHLTSGTVTLIDSPDDADATIADVTSGLFLTDASGNAGASGLAIRPAETGGIIYVGSLHEDRVQTLTVGRPVNGAPPFLLQGEYFFLDGVGGNSGLSADTRALAFGEGGTRLYTVNREPPTVQVFDTSTSEQGVPRNTFLAAHDLCRVANRIGVVPTSRGDRTYVSCFQDGQLYIVDPNPSGIDDIVTVGRGAFDIAASPTRGRVYVTNFLDDTVAVVEVDEGSPLHNRVVLQLGISRNLE